MATGAFLGLLQGLFEWLPVSSQGAVTAIANLVLDRDIDEAIALGLWLHLGTSMAAAIAFRAEVLELLREAVRRERPRSPRFDFLVLATAVSIVVGLPLVLTLDNLSSRAGSAAMIAVGVAMLFTGAVQLASPRHGTHGEKEIGRGDAVLAGLAQGLATIPGLSRSGLTVAVLLGRGVEREAALRLSFLMSIPAGLGAALIAGFDSNLLTSIEGLVGAFVALAVGLVSIRLLLALARHVNFAAFVLLMGAAIAGGGIWQTLA
jgi:undecaprenyl-diphosphatase